MSKEAVQVYTYPPEPGYPYPQTPTITQPGHLIASRYLAAKENLRKTLELLAYARMRFATLSDVQALQLQQQNIRALENLYEELLKEAQSAADALLEYLTLRLNLTLSEQQTLKNAFQTMIRTKEAPREKLTFANMFRT